MANERPRWKTNNPEDSKFCKECAAPLLGTKAKENFKILEASNEEFKRGLYLLEDMFTYHEEK